MIFKNHFLNVETIIKEKTMLTRLTLTYYSTYTKNVYLKSSKNISLTLLRDSNPRSSDPMAGTMTNKQRRQGKKQQYPIPQSG
jgi:hypothetical protein